MVAGVWANMLAGARANFDAVVSEWFGDVRVVVLNVLIVYFF